jgi:DNA repair exonuclease SbcCD nuclease subunit
MKILITADIHFGVPGRAKDIAWSIDIMSQYAVKHKIKDVLILGDLFHDRVNINIEVLNIAYQSLKNAKDRGQNWVCFPGNHDMFLKNSWEINSVKPLEGILHVVEKPTEITIAGQTFIVLPFIHHETEYMKALEKLKGKTEVLLTHVGVHGATLNECFLIKNWSVVKFDNTQFNKVYAGHFHCQQSVGKLHYPGSPIPFRFDEGVVDHGFIIHDTETNKHEFIKIFEISSEFSDYTPPDFLTISSEDIDDSIDMFENNNIRIVLSEELTTNEKITLKEKLSKHGAQKISFMPPKQKTEEIDEANAIADSMGTPNELFTSYLEYDKPDLDTELLMKLHNDIVTKAEERIIIEEDDDA